MKSLTKVLLLSFLVSSILSLRIGAHSLILFIGIPILYGFFILFASFFTAFNIKNADEKTIIDYQKRVESFRNQ